MLFDGHRVYSSREREDSIVVHSGFRLVFLANRPGYRKLSFDMINVVVSDDVRAAFL